MKKPGYRKQQFSRISFPLAVALLVLAIQFVNDTDVLHMRYDREAILAGEYWRLVSGQFLHMTWTHLALNLAGLFVIWALFKDILSPVMWWSLLAGSIAGVSTGLLVFQPSLEWYVGLSGALHGLFAGGAVCALCLHGKRGGVFLGVLVGKLVYEQLSGPLPGTAELSGAPVITVAHLYGAVGGAVLLVLALVTGLGRCRQAPTRHEISN